MHHIAAPRVVCSALLVAASKGVQPADVFCALPLPISHAVPVAGHQCPTPLIKGQAGGPHRALLRANQGRNHALHSAAGQQEVQEGHIQVVATAGEQAWQTQPMQHPASQESDAEPSQLDGGTGMAPSHLQQAQAPNPFANGSAGFTSAGPFGNQPLDAGSPAQPAPVGEQVFGDSTPVTRVVHHHRSDSLAIAAPATEHSEPSFENPPQFAVQADQVGASSQETCIALACCAALLVHGGMSVRQRSHCRLAVCRPLLCLRRPQLRAYLMRLRRGLWQVGTYHVAICKPAYAPLRWQRHMNCTDGKLHLICGLLLA